MSFFRFLQFHLLLFTLDKMKLEKSPYLKESGRLADVIAAIQVMSIYKFYQLDFNKWAERISGENKDPNHWKTVFREHPEFFRIDTGNQKASLVWRRTYPKAFQIDTGKTISPDELEKMNSTMKARVSRKPLTESEIETLISTAISLHSSALNQHQDKRWWLTLVGFGVGILPFLIEKIFG